MENIQIGAEEYRAVHAWLAAPEASARFVAMTNGFLLAVPFILSGACNCEACETVRGIFAGIQEVSSDGH